MKKNTIKTVIMIIAITFSAMQLLAQAATSQDSIEREKLRTYFAKNDIQYGKDPYGYYFSVSKLGKGKEVADSSIVKIRYKQRVFSDKMKKQTVFPNLKHVKPLVFKQGKGIAPIGLDDGVCYLPKGSKVTLYIPSSMAYGATKHGTIPPNSILIYDVEILN